jgi:uncharacterized protein
MPPESHTGLTPTPAHERYEFLDVLRGFALAGIVLANMVSYSLYLYLPEEAKARVPAATWDGIIEFFELALIEAKFYTIFSVLFGVGFSILIARAKANGLAFHRFFLRRMVFLFFIGLAHAVLFWHNDILAAYAVCGALLLPFAAADNRTILLASVAALTAPAVVSAAGVLPADTFTGPRDLLLATFGFTTADRVDIWAHGALPDIVRLNIASWFGQVDYVITSGMIFRIYGCFLLGLAIGRNGIHARLGSYSAIIQRTALFGLGIGIPLNVVYALTFESESWVYTTVATLGVVPLSAGYASLLAVVWMRNGRGLTDVFGPVGRMALTNYVAQSLICALIFRGVGLGLGGQLGPTLYLPIGLTVYMTQVVISRAWLTRFQFGPLEWLWRMLTYGRRVRLLKTAPVLAR